MTLTDHEDVRDDLELTSEQRWRIESIKETTRKEDDRLFAGIDRGNTDHGERPPFSTSTENWRQAEERVVDVLTLVQRDRLRGLQLQSLGFRAIFEEDLQSYIQIDPDQLATIRRFQIDQEREASEAYGALGVRITIAEGERTRRRLQRDAEARAMALLTPAQVRRYRERLGKRLATTDDWTRTVG